MKVVELSEARRGPARTSISCPISVLFSLLSFHPLLPLSWTHKGEKNNPQQESAADAPVGSFCPARGAAPSCPFSFPLPFLLPPPLFPYEERYAKEIRTRRHDDQDWGIKLREIEQSTSAKYRGGSGAIPSPFSPPLTFSSSRRRSARRRSDDAVTRSWPGEMFTNGVARVRLSSHSLGPFPASFFSPPPNQEG